MKISFSPYELHPLTVPNARVPAAVKSGALLKVEADGVAGYSDLCPLIEYGDGDLSTQLESIGENQPLPLAKRSLQLAEYDRVARKAQKSFYSEARIKNHFLCTDLLEFNIRGLPKLVAEGFTELKFKIGSDLRLETLMLEEVLANLIQLPSRVKVRLDFNGVLNGASFSNWIAKLNRDQLQALDFIEDPFPYEPALWQEISERYKVRLALDLEIEKIVSPWGDLRGDFEGLPGVDVLVVKPVRQQVEQLIHKFSTKHFVVTHAMDFAVGQMHALAMAHELVRQGVKLESCGLQSKNVFAPSEFQRLLQYDGPYISNPEGFGIGLDEELAGQDWQGI